MERILSKFFQQLDPPQPRDLLPCPLRSTLPATRHVGRERRVVLAIEPPLPDFPQRGDAAALTAAELLLQRPEVLVLVRRQLPHGILLGDDHIVEGRHHQGLHLRNRLRRCVRPTPGVACVRAAATPP